MGAWPPARPPVLAAQFRQSPEDFRVEEMPITAPSGKGEFDLVEIEKRELNTSDVARRLAEFAQVSPRDVSFAGRKDRHALTSQWFSVHLPGRESPAWDRLNGPGLRVLAAGRHHRKLRRGALAGNRFRIRLRELNGDRAAIDSRLAEIAAGGVPNYFGSQRFGVAGSNLRAVHARRRMSRERRSLALSAARAFLFNAVLGERVAAGCWNVGLPGEVWMPRRSRGIFGPETDPAEAERRCREGEIDPTGPLWGRGALRTEEAVRELEEAVVGVWARLARFLEHAGLQQERRRLRLLPGEWTWTWVGADLEMGFTLEPGAFATAVLQDLGDVQPPPVTS